MPETLDSISVEAGAPSCFRRPGSDGQSAGLDVGFAGPGGEPALRQAPRRPTPRRRRERVAVDLGASRSLGVSARMSDLRLDVVPG